MARHFNHNEHDFMTFSQRGPPFGIKVRLSRIPVPRLPSLRYSSPIPPVGY